MNYPAACRTPPWPHQLEHNATLQSQPAYAILDDVGFGKTKTAVDAVCDAYTTNKIDAVIVVAPGNVLSVWGTDPLLSGILPHVWAGMHYSIHPYTADNKHAKTLPFVVPAAGTALAFVVTNYEYIRRWVDPRKRLSRTEVLDGRGFVHLEPLVRWAKKHRTWLILDEAWAVSEASADQTRACYILRQHCTNVTILNGTPGKPEKQFAMWQILDENILGLKSFAQFRNKYLVMGGYQVGRGTRFARGTQVVGYQNVEEYRERTEPYARRNDEGLGLPGVLPPMAIEARLSDKEWTTYCQMRDEMVAWLESGDAAVARQAGVKALRLLQILSGYVGGIVGDEDSTAIVGDAKIKAVLDFSAAHDLQRLVVWCRFRAEMARLGEAFARLGRVVHYLQGNQPPDERNAAKRAFAPSTDEQRPSVLIGHPAAGGAGITLAAAHVAIYTSSPGLKDLLQSRGRLNRPGQTKPVRFVDVIGVGPKGQRTLDHALVEAHRKDEDIATWTAAHWRRALTDS